MYLETVVESIKKKKCGNEILSTSIGIYGDKN